MRILSVFAFAACCATQPPVAPVRSAPVSSIALTYLGVAGWTITDGTRTVVIDPYLSRPNLDAPLVPDERAVFAHTPAQVDAILVGHSHYDHLLDAPTLARRTGAELIGSRSTARFAHASGIPDEQLVVVKGGEDYQFKGFSVRVIPSLHSALDEKHLFGGDEQIDENATTPLTAEGFAEGGKLDYLLRLGGHDIVIIDSANFIERELAGLRPDVAIVATGLREEIHDYACRLMHALGQPPLVLANHFDAFRAPLGTPLTAEAEADLRRFADEIHACAPNARVVVPIALQPITL